MRFKIVLFILSILLIGGTMAQASESCIDVIVDNFDTRCIDGYEWLVKYEKLGCMTSVIPVAQKFEIAYKKNGTPRMMLPVPCTVIE